MNSLRRVVEWSAYGLEHTDRRWLARYAGSNQQNQVREFVFSEDRLRVVDEQKGYRRDCACQFVPVSECMVLANMQGVCCGHSRD